jgi:hypothetical protein
MMCPYCNNYYTTPVGGGSDYFYQYYGCVCYECHRLFMIKREKLQSERPDLWTEIKVKLKEQE